MTKTRPYSKLSKGKKIDQTFGDIWIKDNQGLSTENKNLSGKYCSKLYNWLEVDMLGNAWLCCPSWLPYSIGNILENDIHELWNSDKARTLRNQIFSGEWNFCQHKFCPEIVSDRLPDLKDVNSENFLRHEIEAVKNKSTISKSLPVKINFSNDESCNLYCPSCRVKKILFTEGEDYDKRKKINDNIYNFLFTEPTDRYFEIFVTGSGDPFASKIYRDMLQNIDGSKFPNLKVNLQTNGVMFTPKMWNKIEKIHSNLQNCAISFDAGTKDTYENKTRLGGTWDMLLKNCQYLDTKVNDFPSFKINYDFVVQADNFREMIPYINLIKENFKNYSEISFSLISDWGTWKPNEYELKCIWKNTHPLHEEFLKILQDPIFKDNKINLGNVKSLWKTANE
jgi:hypothetical protein